MQKIIVYVDDAAHAAQRIASLRAGGDASAGLGEAPVHWVLVACAPRLTHRISKWVTHSARENWREKWADRLFGEMAPALGVRAGDSVTRVLARGPLPELTRQLLAAHDGATVVDARRPKSEAAGPEVPPPKGSPGMLAGLAAMLFLSFE